MRAIVVYMHTPDHLNSLTPMKRTELLPSLLITGMALGTAWAVRGQFGHEHAAAWAGGIGCLTILLLSGRADWLKNAFNATLAGALGWGLGGIMSYGKVVGYGRSTDFGNVYYGLLMLFVIGGLYGFLGGGLFGISLSNPKGKKSIAWHRIMTEMTIGAIVVYFFVIGQFGWLMTPPRSELWAACLGMAAAITWYMIRQEMYSALKVAIITGFGAGFGFAFGNFLQVLGSVSKLDFNFWNVMEYTLGFSGGLSMAYAVFTSGWEEKRTSSSSKSWILPVIVLLLVIPAIMWEQNTNVAKMHEHLSRLSAGVPRFVSAVAAIGPYILFLAAAGYWVCRLNALKTFDRREIFSFYRILLGIYILMSLLVTGSFVSVQRIEQYLYLVNFAVILYFLPRLEPAFRGEPVRWKSYALNLVWFLLFTALLAVVASNSHSEDLGGTNYRFGALANPDKK